MCCLYPIIVFKQQVYTIHLHFSLFLRVCLGSIAESLLFFSYNFCCKGTAPGSSATLLHHPQEVLATGVRLADLCHPTLFAYGYQDEILDHVTAHWCPVLPHLYRMYRHWPPSFTLSGLVRGSFPARTETREDSLYSVICAGSWIPYTASSNCSAYWFCQFLQSSRTSAVTTRYQSELGIILKMFPHFFPSCGHA